MNCGGCQNFIKVKNNEQCKGLCILLDYNTRSDCGNKCIYFKAIPYVRRKK